MHPPAADPIPRKIHWWGGQDKQESPPVLPGPQGHPGREDGGLDVPTVAEPPRDPQRGPASTRGGSCRGGDTAPVCHSVPTPQRMLVRAGGSVCHLPIPLFQANTAMSPSCPPKILWLFWGGGNQTPIFWLNCFLFFSLGKRSPAAHSRVPAAAPNPRDGCPRGSALLRCWGTPHSGWGGTRDPHSALVLARR